MASNSIPTVLAMVERGTRLTFHLYDFSSNVSSATGDINRLAKEVNLLSQVLRQIGSRLKEDGTLPSPEAVNTVGQILEQCQDVFNEVEALVPVRQLHDAQSQAASAQLEMGVILHLREELDWNALSAARVAYLLAHLEGLKLTLSVMLQTLYTAKTAAWSRHEKSQKAYNAVVVERLQMESLIIEQQLALIRAYRLYAEFKRQVSNAPLSMNGTPHSQALIQRDEYGPNPRALVSYQEPSLARFQPSPNEAEDLSKVRLISSPYVDFLLSRWTTLNVIEEQIRQQLEYKPREQLEYKPCDRQRRNSNWQPTACESDSEDGEGRKKQSRLHLSTNEPILMHVNDDGSRGITSPISTGLRPPSGPFSPQPPNSWVPAPGGYFPPNSPHQAHLTPGPSPFSSPRTSFSSTEPPPSRPQTAFRNQPVQGPQKPPILWRIRINQNYWDHADANIVYSNTRADLTSALKEARRDRESRDSAKPITEVNREYISQDVIQDEDYEYTKVKRDRYDEKNRKTRMETWYCIEGALSFSEISRLVDLTTKMRNSWGSDIEDRGSRSGGPVMPLLERTRTTPVQRSRSSGGTGRELRGSGSSTSNSSDSSEEYKPSASSRSKSRVRRESSTTDYRGTREADYTTSRHDSLKRHDSNSSKPRSYSRSDSSRPKGNAKAQTAMKIAAGAGLATLLDGFGEGFGELLSHL